MRPAHGRRGALSGIGTFEFLVDDERPGRFYFMEANPRIQVEHTVTEEVTGVDLLHAQLRLAAGMELAALGLERPPAIGGCAVQLRINLETLAADGSARPAVGTIGAYEPPSGPGLRVDGYGYAGYRVSPSYDSLLAKLVVRGADYPAALRRAYRALCEFRLEGVASNLDLLRNLLLHPAVQANRVDTRFVESHLETLLAPIPASHPRLRAECPLAEDAAPARVEAPLGSLPLSAPSSGVLVALEVADGERVRAGQRVAILEAMKMEFEVKAPGGGIVRRLAASLGSLWRRARRCCSSNRRRMTTSRHRPNRRWTWRISAPISPRYSSARQRWATSVVRRRWPGGARPDSVPRGRTCSTCWTRAASANMAVSPWPPSVAGAPPRSCWS